MPYESLVIMRCTGLLWVLLDIAIAVLGLYRFRTTRSGILLGLGHGMLAFNGMVFAFFIPWVLGFIGGQYMITTVVGVLSQLIRFTMYIVVALGIGFIPQSLGRLARR
jgi:hypothetical protein